MLGENIRERRKFAIYNESDFHVGHSVAATIFNFHYEFQPMLDYANRLQEDTGMQFPLHGGSIFNKLCEIYHQFQVSTSV